MTPERSMHLGAPHSYDYSRPQGVKPPRNGSPAGACIEPLCCVAGQAASHSQLEPLHCSVESR
eukprot:2226175-Alexandrium_andersonii.AAC.1